MYGTPRISIIVAPPVYEVTEGRTVVFMALKTLKLSKRRALNLILECGIIGTDPRNMCPKWVYTTTNIRTWSKTPLLCVCPSKSHGWPEGAWAWE